MNRYVIAVDGLDSHDKFLVSFPAAITQPVSGIGRIVRDCPGRLLSAQAMYEQDGRETGPF